MSSPHALVPTVPVIGPSVSFVVRHMAWRWCAHRLWTASTRIGAWKTSGGSEIRADRRERVPWRVLDYSATLRPVCSIRRKAGRISRAAAGRLSRVVRPRQDPRGRRGPVRRARPRESGREPGHRPPGRGVWGSRPGAMVWRPLAVPRRGGDAWRGEAGRGGCPVEQLAASMVAREATQV